jgi:hypothetical protein
VTRGTRKENPVKTRNAPPKASQRGPVESARKQKAAAKKMESNPLINQAGDGRTERSTRVPPCNASTGSSLAAACAGNQAEAMTDPTPMIQAMAKLDGRNVTSRTFTRT